MNATHQLFASWHVEVVKNVRQQRDVVTFAEVRFKRAPGLEGDAIGYARGRRIFLCDCQDGSPVSRGDVRVRILYGNGDSKHPVSRGDVQYLARFSFLRAGQVRDKPGR